MSGDGSRVGAGLKAYSAILQAVAIATGIVFGVVAFRWITG